MNLKQNSSLSDETLNALVDNEFPASERAKILADLQTDKVSKQIKYLSQEGHGIYQ